MNSKLVSFRKLLLADLPLMHGWLNKPHVHEWYDKDKENSIEDVEKRYGPKIRDQKPTDCYVVLYKERPVAYLQTYFVNDWPEFGKYIGYDDQTAAVDLFIGEEEFMGRGLGSVMLSKFVEEVVFRRNGVTTCVIGPEPDNKRAIRAYEKAGFVYKKTVQIPNEKQPTYIMERRKVG